MKIIILVLALILQLSVQGQGTDKGVVPVTNLKSGYSGVTRAVVVGISKYLTPEITDLKYADKDAIAFANWLKSPAGGSVPEQNIQLYTNEDASQETIGMALWDLVDSSKTGDRTIIYFSGHGDVEGRLVQKGYLLTYNSPKNIYSSGGAYSLADLADRVNEMSINGVQVILISDACRSGAFSGSDFGGPQATVTQMQKYFENQILLPSCQHNEYSLEGEQWCGGRGLFSYQLENALYGLADQDQDMHIQLRELRNYLESEVMKAAEPNHQTPKIDGPITAQICRVDPLSLADFQKRMISSSRDFMDTEGRSVLKFPDTLLYAHFIAAIEADKLLSPAGESANDYFNQMISDPAWEPYYGHIKRKFVAALTKEAQLAINRLLKTDPKMADEAFQGKVRYSYLPAYLNRACDVLGEKHYLYPYLKAKQYYFESRTYTNKTYPDLSTDSLVQLSLQAIEKGLAYDTGAAYLYLEKGINYYWKQSSFEESKQSFRKALDLSPTWVLANFYYGLALSGNGANGDNKEMVIAYLKEAIKYDSTFLPAYERLSWRFPTKEEKNFWREEYVWRMRDLQEKDPDNIPATYYRYMGLCLLHLNILDEAEKYFLKGAEMSNYEDPLYFKQLGMLYEKQKKYIEAARMIKKYRLLRPNDTGVTIIANPYFSLMLPSTDRTELIETHNLNTCIEKKQDCLLHFYYFMNHDFESCRNIGKEHFNDVIEKVFKDKTQYLAHRYYSLGDPVRAIMILKDYVFRIENGINELAKDSLKHSGGAYGQLTAYNLALGNIAEAELWFAKKGMEDELCFDLAWLGGWSFGLKTWLAFSRGRFDEADSLIKEHKDQVEFIYAAEDVLQLIAISNQVDYAIFILEAILKYYQPTPDIRYHLARIYIEQKGDYPHGLPLLEQAVQLDPEQPNFAYHLATAYTHFNRLDDALSFLEKALELGYDNFEELARDKRWNTLRNTERFMALMNKYWQE